MLCVLAKYIYTILKNEHYHYRSTKSLMGKKPIVWLHFILTKEIFFFLHYKICWHLVSLSIGIIIKVSVLVSVSKKIQTVYSPTQKVRAPPSQHYCQLRSCWCPPEEYDTWQWPSSLQYSHQITSGQSSHHLYLAWHSPLSSATPPSSCAYLL